MEIIPIVDGGRTLPSTVAYKSDANEVLVGKAAKEHLVRNLTNTIYDAKRMIGKKFDDEGITEFRKFWNFDIVEGRMGKPKVKINV